MKASHYTPEHLISLVECNLPENVSTVLEPSVGDGSLLRALLSVGNKISLTAVDIDFDTIEGTRDKYRDSFYQVDFVNDDFLIWSDPINNFQEFDLILMNPPFNAKKSNWVFYDGEKIPVEYAFFSRAMKMCKEGGTIIAILPHSIISSYSSLGASYRRRIFSSFRVICCYELNEFDFPGIEGRFYLLAVEKCRDSFGSGILVISSDGSHINLTSNDLSSSGYRLDYKYYYSFQCYERLFSIGKFKTASIFEIADVVRGRISAPNITKNIIHTRDYSFGWADVNGKDEALASCLTSVEEGDILLKRVGRRCLASLGLYTEITPSLVSDCILIVKSRHDNFEQSWRILFSLRVLYANSQGESFITSGTGAKYITIRSMSDLKIIYNLAELYSEEYAQWKRAFDSFDEKLVLSIESKLFEKLSS